MKSAIDILNDRIGAAMVRVTGCQDCAAIVRPATDPRFGRAGYEQARWILLDFVDVVVHLFDPEYRQFYDLDLLWGDAERIDY